MLSQDCDKWGYASSAEMAISSVVMHNRYHLVELSKENLQVRTNRGGMPLKMKKHAIHSAQ